LASSGAPGSFFGVLDGDMQIADIGVVKSLYRIGPFPTNDIFLPYVKIDARAVKCSLSLSSPYDPPATNIFAGAGAVGAENTWVTIYEQSAVAGDYAESPEYGTIALPSRPPYIYHDANVQGYTTEVSNQVLYYFSFQYCLNKYW